MQQPEVIAPQATKLTLKIQRCINAVKELLLKVDNDQRSAQFLIMGLRIIEQLWNIVQKVLEELWKSPGDNYDLDEFFLQESIINDGMCELTERIKAFEMKTSANTEHRKSSGNDVKVPTKEVSVCNGNSLKLPQYKDMFMKLVLNQQLSGCQKLWYLKTSLTGKAARLFQNLSTTSKNYLPACQIICNRYENEPILGGKTLQCLFSQQPIQRYSSASIKSLHDTSLEYLLGLKALGLKIENWDPIIVNLITQLLVRETQMLWEQSLTDPHELIQLQDLMKFLELRFQSMKAVGSSKKVGQSPNSLITTINLCIACNQNHGLLQCHKFKAMTAKQRLNLVQSARNCVHCLKSDHKTKQCLSTNNCQRCNKRHNTMLHLDSQQSKGNQSFTNSTSGYKSIEASSSPKPPTASSLIAVSQREKSAVLLSTVVILVENACGQQVVCRAILDNGSQVHLITQHFATKLGLQEFNSQSRIQGVGETHRNTTTEVNIQISSRITACSSRIKALILPKILSQQPRQYIETQNWKIPKNIILGDPCFNTPGDIDMLIGAGIFYSVLRVGQIKLGTGLPTLQNTVLGWVVGGEHPVEQEDAQLVCVMCTEEEELFSTMERFWEIEECSTSSRQMTADELKCENHFASTYRRAADHRFVVKLPFRDDASKLGQSYGIALQRLRGLEKRLSKDKKFHDEYIKFMQEYQRLGHMEEIAETQVRGSHYFLSHYGVVKPGNTTIKVRVVFDASVKTSSNVSLNDVLAIGPTIQDEVFTTLLRFRFPRYVFTAEIEKMYRQIWVHKDDRPFQLILWREDPEQPVKIFQLKTVTFGTSCAPYLAIRCLRQLTDKGVVQYPLAAQLLTKNVYVDDVLAGADNIHTAADQIHQLRDLLSTAGLNLGKWCSNDQRLLNQVPEGDIEVNLEISQPCNNSIKAMGLMWTPKQDCFSVRNIIIMDTRVTKRIALAEILKIFDPLGFIAPVTITAKIFLQNLCKLKLDWDAALPQDLHSEWTGFRKEFDKLNQIKVPRHCFGHEQPKNVQIHIFAEASEKAYGAVAYIRSVSKHNLVIIRLLCAKSKVASIKPTNLPRLELCAAALAADLMKRIQNDLDMDSNCFHLWSDSIAVLGWLNAQSTNYHTFVANRIASIQRVSTINQWHYIPSQDNPADMIARGLYPRQLIHNNVWFYGPKLLHGKVDTWSSETLQIECSLEMKQKAKVMIAVRHSDDDIISQINHHNSFRRLQRIITYILRCHKPKLPGFELLGKANLVVRPSELEISLQRIVKYMQEGEFQHHIKDIRKYKAVQHTSSIAHLSPFLDDNGILRVGGRFESADISYDAKHPILLSHKHPLTKLLLTELHKENMHTGVHTLIAISRQRFWIINGKTLARNVVHNCIQCKRAKPKLAEKIMRQLPKDQVTAARPFLIIGVDFFGPIYVLFKIRGKYPQKAYVSAFCCFLTKAVHLEIVCDLSTEAFIGALKRFIGRRGKCQKIYFDNATNFKGEKNILSNLIHTEKAQNQILTVCNKNNIEVCFIPPRAPLFGGLWEAAVKSANSLLQSTLSSASLTYEEMETVLIDAEAILNSRPITPLSSDPNDMTALTPGHCIIGEPLTTVVDPYEAANNISGQKRWNLVRHLKNEFWRRWSMEYLSGLQHRYKWNKECQNIKKGTMVIIKDENLPPFKWALGRVDRVIPGEDGRVRVADVRTAHNISRRPIHTLAPLPVEEAPGKVQPGLSDATTLAATRYKATNSRKRKSTAAIATLLSTCIILPFTTASSVKVTPFQGDPGLYFKRVGMVNIIPSTVRTELTQHCRRFATSAATHIFFFVPKNVPKPFSKYQK